MDMEGDRGVKSYIPRTSKCFGRNNFPPKNKSTREPQRELNVTDVLDRITT